MDKEIHQHQYEFDNEKIDDIYNNMKKIKNKCVIPKEEKKIVKTKHDKKYKRNEQFSNKKRSENMFQHKL
jgi:hypothetical protein